MEPDPDVLEMVREQLDRDSPPSTEALYGRAARINRGIYELSLRQFNATYVLRVKRERKRAERERAPTGDGSGPDRGGGREDEEEGGTVEPRPGGFLDAVREAESDGGSGPGDDEEGSGPGEPGAASPEAGGSDEMSGSADAEGASAGDPGTASRAVDRSLRDRIREVLWRYARDVAAVAGAAGAVAAVEGVEDRVEEILELNRLATGGRGKD